MPFTSKEDSQVFAEVLDSAIEENAGAGLPDIPSVLSAYNERRSEDVVAVCTLSELSLGGARMMRPSLAAQLLITVLLNKTLGLIAPKVGKFERLAPTAVFRVSGSIFTPCSHLMANPR